MKKSELIRRIMTEGIPHDYGHSNDDTTFEHICFDSRKVKPSSVFFAFRGEAYDSHDDAVRLFHEGKIDFIVSERDLGAEVDHFKVKDGRIALSQALSLYFGDPLEKYMSVAITGTNGKTTSAYIVDAIFKAAGHKTVRIGTTGADINGKFYEIENTTPSPYDVYSMLAEGLSAGCTALSIEVSSHALAQGRLAGAKFNVAVFTNLTGDHLDFHKDMESYYKAKALLFNDNMSEHKIVNIGHEYGEHLAKELATKALTFAAGRKADIYTENFTSTVDGITANVNVCGKMIEIKSHLIGLHNIENILGALAATYSIGIPLEICAKGILSLENVPGRLERYAKDGITTFVDYAHTDDALVNVITALRNVATGRIITVFGAGGDRDKTKRPRMAKVASELSDATVVTSDNPRTEDPLKIITDIEKGLIRGKSKIIIEPDRELAIRAALSEAHAGDIVLVAGKGHEDYQIIGKTKYPFSDMAVIKKYL